MQYEIRDIKTLPQFKTEFKPEPFLVKCRRCSIESRYEDFYKLVKKDCFARRTWCQYCRNGFSARMKLNYEVTGRKVGLRIKKPTDITKTGRLP